MSYQSFGFLLFCVAVALVYYLVGRKRQQWVLALANLAFYAIAGLDHLPFLLVTMVSTFLVGKRIGTIYQQYDEKIAAATVPAEKKELRAQAKTHAKRVLLLGMGITIGLLAVCKYTGFAIANLNALLGALGIPQIQTFRMILPLGISFYSFMALSYVLDIFWKRYKPEQNFLTYAVYLSYFPHVVQGPIDRFNEFKSQLEGGVAFDYETVAFGAQLTLWGLFKKLVIANRLGIFVDDIFGRWDSVYGIMLVLALAVYSIQIYADFSGCIDIVTGVSEIFGIKLRKNFNHPYFARTMAEFWRRWHISLQEWFKDYVYFPVSASGLIRKVKKHCKTVNKPKTAELFSACFPIFVVWMITGIWHGASWNFVIWGIFHAIVLIGSHILEPFFRKLSQKLHLDTENFGWYFIQMCRTYAICCVGRVFFRASDVSAAFGIIRRILTSPTPSGLFDRYQFYGLDTANVIVAGISVLVLLVVDILQEKMPLRQTLAKQNTLFRWALILLAMFSVIIFGIYGPGYDAASFIYEQF